MKLFATLLSAGLLGGCVQAEDESVVRQVVFSELKVNGNLVLSECTFIREEPYPVQARPGDTVILREVWVSVYKTARTISQEKRDSAAYFCGSSETTSVSRGDIEIYKPECLAARGAGTLNQITHIEKVVADSVIAGEEYSFSVTGAGDVLLYSTCLDSDVTKPILRVSNP